MSTDQKSLVLSLRAYRGLLRMYPRNFLNQFGEQLVQAFGDLARRAVSRGGTAGLVLLWMRMLPDVGRSALREYLNVAAGLGPSDSRLRWILACTLGSGLGVFAGAQMMTWPGATAGILASICLTLGLGLFQSVWALRRSGPDAARWMAATMVGVFALALPFRLAIAGLPLARLSTSGEIAALVLAGAGIGLLQCLGSHGKTVRAWRWVAVNAFAFLSAGIAARSVVDAAGPSSMALFLSPFAGGLAFGCLTVIALDSVASPGVQTGEVPSAAS